ncbi:MAG: HEAT repeat domain-containing protein, partial [Bacteroidota bacterium]
MKQTNHDSANLPSDIHALINLLHSSSGAVRKEAREKLVRIGKSVVPLVLPLLSHKNELVRWEACKTLEKIRDPRAASALAEMLLDDDMDVRWVAADALVELEHHAIRPVLEMIEKHFDSVLLREASHHVLRSLKEIKLLDEETEKVLEALSLHELPTRAAFAATAALDSLRKKKRSSVRHVA